MVGHSTSAFFEAIKSGNYSVLRPDLQTNGRLVASLQAELGAGPVLDDKTIEQLVDGQAIRFGSSGQEWTRFNIMLVSFLKYCRDVNPWSTYESCDLIFEYYQDFSNCLLNDTYPIEPLVPLIKEFTEYVIPIATKLDNNYRTLRTRKYQFLSFIASVVSKLFNSVKPPRDSTQDVQFTQLPNKQQILLYLINKLNNIYFKIGSPQLCSNIFKNFRAKATNLRFAQFPVPEQIEYRYLLGRYYLLNNRITNAFVQLNNAFDLLTASADLVGTSSSEIGRNLCRILKYLIPAGLILSKTPKYWLIEKINPILADKYRKLAHIIKTGNINAMNEWLRKYETELRRDHLFLTLLEKLPMLLYRNLIRTVIMYWTIPQHTGRLPYSVIQTALELSIGNSRAREDEPLTVYNSIHSPDNVENVLITLINLGFLKGNCFPLLKTCVVSKTQDVNEVCPPIQDKIVAVFPLNSEDNWLNA